MSLEQKDLIAAIDGKNGRFRIDRVKIITPDGVHKGAGVLECGDELMLSITLPRGKAIPRLGKNIVAKKDFWKLEGVIEGSLSISIESLSPPSKWNSNNGVNTVIFNVSELDVTPSDFDRKTNAQILKMIGRKEEANKSKSKSSKKKNAEVEFFAVLKGYKLIGLNKGTKISEKNDFLGRKSSSRADTFMGVLRSWKFGLIQVGEDVHVYLKSTRGYVSKGKTQDQLHLDAFLRAIAFIHGQHAWPSQLQYRCDHKMLTNKIRVIGITSRTHHSPFSEALWYNDRIGRIKCDFSDGLLKAYEFFLNRTALSEEIEELLYLLREAGGKSVPMRIELLTVCTLYESLMRAIFSRDPQSRTKTEEVLVFTETKKKLVEELKLREALAKGSEAAALSRIAAILKNASAESIREIVRIITEGLLKGTAIDWNKIHGEWGKFRNPLAHKISQRSGAKDDFSNELLAVSRISGAINVVILKLMDYSGFARVSTYEDAYKEI